MIKPSFIVVIPARFASTRLPGKPLAEIHGRPMIQWVHDRAITSGADEVMIATDDRRILAACEGFCARAYMTRAEHESGTDRIAELAERFAWADERIVVNVQGDEPMIPPALISQVAQLAASDTEAAIATLITPITSDADRHNPNVAKVVVDRAQRALYFSRAPIPWPRDGGAARAFRHIGLYAYRAAALRELAAAGPCELEQIEKLEQLRALWLGLKVAVAEAVEPPAPGVDTAEDLEAARACLARAP